MSDLSHVDDYPEIPVSFGSTITLKTGAWRSVRPVRTERPAPCSDACPAGVSVPSYVHDLGAGRLEEAFAAFTSRNPFPRITGRVCPHFCEQGCNRPQVITGEPVSIRAVERYLGDATARLPHPSPEPATGKRVAVVGAGPAGLSAAYYLRRSGHEVTVYDRRQRAGGMLRYGIPEYRLPTAIVDDEVERLDAMGIEFRTGVVLGEDLTLDELELNYAAVFAATGAWTERTLGIEGAGLLEPGLAFLEQVNRGDAELPGRSCAVIGAGNTAMDLARVLVRMGAAVTVLYRRTESEMPAIPEEYERAVQDGVAFRWLTVPRRVEKDGSTLAVTVEQMQLGVPDASGRPRPEPTGETDTLDFDAVFSAIGEMPDDSPFPETMKDASGRLILDGSGDTQSHKVLVGGDLATGPGTVVQAIAAGRRAAMAINSRIGGGSAWQTSPVDGVVVAPDEVNAAYVTRAIRTANVLNPAAAPFTEETTTISDRAVLAEIERCLSCGHCNDCGTCFVFCPDGAVHWEDGPVIDYDFCKGCGVCVTECPGHALVLVNERELAHA